MSSLKTTNILHPSSTTNNIVLASDGTTTIASPSNIIKSGTSVASTSGTSIDFTNIPSWVKRVTVMFSGVSLSGTSPILMQIGAGSVTTSGYASSTLFSLTTSVNTNGSTAGFILSTDSSAAALVGGAVQIFTLGSNIWVASGSASLSSSEFSNCAGRVTLSGTLDRVRITTVNGTDTFDAGTVNILYEG